MVTRFAIAALLLVSLNFRAFSKNDTIVVSYEKPFVSVASVYMDVVNQITKDEGSQISFLKTFDPTGFESLRYEIDSIGQKEIDPNDIIFHVRKKGNPKFESNYVRLVFTQMMARYLGLRTPLKIKMAFNKNGYLSYFECRGFRTLDDGFILSESILLSANRIHKSQLKKFGA